MSTLTDAPSRRSLRPLSALAISASWFALWCLTPGLTDRGPVRLVARDDALVVFLESLIAGLLAIAIAILQRTHTRALFAPSRQRFLYVIPLALALALPLHDELEFPVLLYLFWMTVSVFWQDYLTFGLLQRHLAARLPSRTVIPVVAALFALGHVILLPDKFGIVPNPLPALSMLTLGLLLAWLRRRFTTMHLILTLHLSFYFIFA
ncbi:CPBP family glutamic-type intramembrane protease [Plantibacter sp. ME-Dv--P-122b]|uniref:CPBP family glutamic-type intramembrane protease n=1 Tax=Plantibacter sp. ME-Dv--P-122b TaxID=3040300 RepID=UPI0025510F61|nr:CPBP family glutamic-type intramembrane protease [Plantibacter sp. ME-Dv--P-122b]